MESHRPLNFNNAKGFTLLEILVVLVLIAIVSGFALPRMAGSMPGVQLKTSAQKIVSLLRHARGRAATEQAPIGVQFDTARGRVAIVSPVQEDSAQNGSVAQASLEGFLLPEDIRLACPNSAPAEQAVIGFYPTGGSTGGEIILSAAGGRQMRVRVAAINGKIEIVAGNR